MGGKGKLNVAGGRRYLRFLCLGGLRGRSSTKTFTHPGGEIQIKKNLHRLSRGVITRGVSGGRRYSQEQIHWRYHSLRYPC